jgi:hypothetical protein
MWKIFLLDHIPTYWAQLEMLLAPEKNFALPSSLYLSAFSTKKPNPSEKLAFMCLNIHLKWGIFDSLLLTPSPAEKRQLHFLARILIYQMAPNPSENPAFYGLSYPFKMRNLWELPFHPHSLHISVTSPKLETVWNYEAHSCLMTK